MTNKKGVAKKKKEGVALKTNVGGSRTVDKDGRVSKTVKKKKAKPKSKDTTEKDKDNGTN